MWTSLTRVGPQAFEIVGSTFKGQWIVGYFALLYRVLLLRCEFNYFEFYFYPHKLLTRTKEEYIIG